MRFIDLPLTSKIIDVEPPPPLNVNWRSYVNKSIYESPLMLQAIEFNRDAENSPIENFPVENSPM